MKNIKSLILIGAFSVLLLSFTQLSPSSPEVPYPEGFREWRHIKTSVMGPHHPESMLRAGFIHIYANAPAVEGYKTHHFANGAVLVFDVLESIDKNSDLTEGERRFVDVMVKDSARYANTGGWGFEEFMKNSKTAVLKEMAVPKCYQCHAKQKDTELVFSKMRD